MQACNGRTLVLDMTYPVYHHISQPYTYHTYIPVDENGGTSPIYALLMLGLVLFMAANVMPALIPAVDRVWYVADPALKWGFFIIISALLVQMLGLLPGVPPIHVTYVHMVTAFLLVAIVWNTFVPVPSTQVEENKTPSVKEDKPTAGKKREISKEETKKEEEISPWDDLRAHPSAFLATRLNKMMPWPFPMGKAAREGKELWWEKGTHLQLGHFNRVRLGKVEEEEGSEKNMKPKPETEKKLKGKTEKGESEKELGKDSMTAGKQKLSSKKGKASGEPATVTATPKREEGKRNQEIAKINEGKANKQAVEDRQRRKLCRTKNLVTIIGISSSRTTFLPHHIWITRLIFEDSEHDPWVPTTYLLFVPNRFPRVKSSYTPGGKTFYNPF